MLDRAEGVEDERRTGTAFLAVKRLMRGGILGLCCLCLYGVRCHWKTVGDVDLSKQFRFGSLDKQFSAAFESACQDCEPR